MWYVAYWQFLSQYLATIYALDMAMELGKHLRDMKFYYVQYIGVI